MKPSQLLRATPSQVKRAARSVTITKGTRSRLKVSGRLRLVATVTSRSRKNLKHRVVVQAVNPKAKNLHDTDVQVWCDCEFFTFYGCADVLPLYNAGFKKKATGIMPDVRNPKKLPFVCLHVTRVLNAIIRTGK